MNTGELFRRRHLPHWDVPRATYFVTGCLAGSIPAQGLLDIERYQKELAGRSRPLEKSEEDWSLDQWKLVFARADHWLDQKPAKRHLADPKIAQIVVDSMYFLRGHDTTSWPMS